MNFIRRLLKEQDGPTSVEYAVLLALILAAIISAVAAFGSQTGTLWGETNQNLTDHGFGS